MQESERVFREKEAYNKGDVWDGSAKLHSRFWHVFSCPDSLQAEQDIQSWISLRVMGATVLDCGCYYGHLSRALAAFNPEKIIGIDISEHCIEQAKQMNGECASFLVADMHATSFPDASFDFIVGRAIIHHLSPEVAIKEISRILKPGGIAIFLEPISDNPLGQLFRKMTPDARTIDEKPLSSGCIKKLDGFFARTHHNYYNFFSIPVAMLTSFLPLPADNVLTRFTFRCDRFLAQTPLRHWMRMVLLVWEK